MARQLPSNFAEFLNLLNKLDVACLLIDGSAGQLILLLQTSF